MIIKSNRKILYEYFFNLTNGQLFSIDDLYSEKDKSIKRYFIKMNPRTIANKPNPNDTIDNYGYAVDLESGDFIVVKFDKKVILEKGHIMLED